jgi:flagellar basal body-associated protein FliL
MSLVLFIIVAAVLVVLAIVLGLKFFNTSVKQEEEQKGWDE